MKFDSKTWENKGQGKQLRGHRIIVRQYNQGKMRTFTLKPGATHTPACAAKSPPRR